MWAFILGVIVLATLLTLVSLRTQDEEESKISTVDLPLDPPDFVTNQRNLWSLLTEILGKADKNDVPLILTDVTLKDWYFGGNLGAQHSSAHLMATEDDVAKLKSLDLHDIEVNSTEDLTILSRENAKVYIYTFQRDFGKITVPALSIAYIQQDIVPPIQTTFLETRVHVPQSSRKIIHLTFGVHGDKPKFDRIPADQRHGDFLLVHDNLKSRITALCEPLLFEDFQLAVAHAIHHGATPVRYADHEETDLVMDEKHMDWDIIHIPELDIRKGDSVETKRERIQVYIETHLNL
jgi:hypothetical protein